jgi:hypothetical protein
MSCAFVASYFFQIEDFPAIDQVVDLPKDEDVGYGVMELMSASHNPTEFMIITSAGIGAHRVCEGPWVIIIHVDQDMGRWPV